VILTFDTSVLVQWLTVATRRAGFGSPVTRIIDSVAVLAKASPDGLGPRFTDLETLGQALTRSPSRSRALQLRRRFYTVLIDCLEASLHGSRFVRVLRAAVEQLLSPPNRRITWIDAALVSSVPPSRVTSARHRVSRSSRSLRGPSAVLVIPYRSRGAALA
jgi:hypothetical protein